jgi:hypothetical protein
VTLYEFNQLEKNERIQFVWDNGQFIETLKQSTNAFSLYSLSDFFVEFELQNEKIVSVRSFKKGDHLDKYINQIDILKLLNENDPE